MTRKEQVQSKVMEISQQMGQGTATKELLTEFTQKWDCAERTVARYIALAKDKVFGELKDKDEILNSVRADYFMELFENNFLSTLELETLLCEIASGKLKVEKHFSTSAGVETVKCEPSIFDRLRAVSALLKLRGKSNGEDGSWNNTENGVKYMYLPQNVIDDMKFLDKPSSGLPPPQNIHDTDTKNILQTDNQQ